MGPRPIADDTCRLAFATLLTHMSLFPRPRPHRHLDACSAKPIAGCWLRLLRLSGACLALVWASLVHAEGRPPAREEIRARLHLLRLKYPTLKAVRFGSLAGKLAAWLPVGQAIPVWVTDSRRQCAEDSLLRRPDRNGTPNFAVRGRTPKTRDEQGRWVRTCVDEPVGRDWWTSDGAVTEVRAGLSWQELSGVGMGDPVQGNGILSEVTVDAARFRGRAARLSTTCENRSMPCSAGGAHTCLVCAPVVEAADACPGCARADYRSPSNPDACDAPCPPTMDAQEQEWIERVNSLQPWIPAEPNEPFGGIYRSLKTCRSDAARFTRLPQTQGEK